MDSTDEKQVEDEQSTSNVEIGIEQTSKTSLEADKFASSVDTSTQTETSSRQKSFADKDEVQPGDTVYKKLDLGLVMKLALRLSGNIKTAVITAISLTIFVSSFDTTGDLFLCLFYVSQGLTTLSVLVLLCDYFPGIVVLAHHMSSNSWQSSTLKEKSYAILTLGCHPFSLLITNIGWLFDVSSKKKHRLARLSTVLHGCLEAPMQFMIISYAQSKGWIPLPWMQSTSISDSNDNVLHLGQITVFSLSFTCIGLVKTASESFEIRSFEHQILATIYAMINLTYRLFSMIYAIIILGKFTLPLFVLIVLINYVVLMYNDNHTRKWASTISTLAVSVFLPIWISESPEDFQIKEDTLMENELGLRQTSEEEEANAKKRVSFRLAIFVTPLLLVSDAVVYYCLVYTEFVQDTVWSKSQLMDFFTILLCPMFLLTTLSSFAFSHLCEDDSTTNNNCKYGPSKLMSKRSWKQAKKYIGYASLFGMITVSVVFGSLVEKLNRTTVAFVNNKNELVVVDVISKGKLLGCDGNRTYDCQNLTFNESDFRTVNLMDGVAYVQRLPKQTVDRYQLDAAKTSFFDLTAIRIWKKDAPEELKNTNPHCKKCLVDSITCNQFLDSIQDVDRCDGKLKNLASSKFLGFYLIVK
jgi:hypothetical protein